MNPTRKLHFTVADVKNPRHFTIAPGGAYLIVAGRGQHHCRPVVEREAIAN
jgi:6-phosphogluconolactonase (cycloisomerase 2 family)